MNPVDHALDYYLERYDGFLLDAYGVLVDGQGVLPGASDFLTDLGQHSRYAIVTNDSSRQPETIANRWVERGLTVPVEQIVTSGMVLQQALTEAWSGARAVVLGTPDAVAYVRAAGLEVVPPSTSFEVFVLADEMGFDFLEGCNQALSGLIRRLRAGDPVAMYLPNPDLVYPNGPAAFGFAAGGVAAMFERALTTFFGEDAPKFERLGKPGSAIFRQGASRLGVQAPLVVGDQLSTDIAGAHQAGYDSALVLSDLPPARDVQARPTYAWQQLPVIRR